MGDAIVVGGSADHVVANPVAQVPLEIAAAEGLSINERGQVVRNAPPAAAAAAPANNASRWDWKSPHKFRVVAHSFNFINSLLYLVVFIMSLTIIEKDENLQNLTIYTQAQNDWTTKLWSDFSWGSLEDPCPDDSYYHLGLWW